MNSNTPIFLGEDWDGSPLPAKTTVGILPLPYEGTVSWLPGTAQGPHALLAASAQVELYDEVIGNEPGRVGIATLPAPDMPSDPQAAVDCARQHTAKILSQGLWPLVVGGEHSLSYGVYQALSAHYPQLGVIQFDAHADLRDEYEGSPYSHASVMARIRQHTQQVAQLGIRALSAPEAEMIKTNGYSVHFMHRMRQPQWNLQQVLDALPAQVFITLDVDALDPTLIRATGTPEPGGLSWDEINQLLAAIFASKIVVGVDVMELAGGDPISAFTMARLVYRMIGWRFTATQP